MNPEKMNTVNGYWMPTVVFDKATGVTREKLQAAFTLENIDARVFFHPLSSLPMFEDKLSNSIAWDIPTRAINLPSYHDISAVELDRVIDVIAKLL
jgi:perosamine synthetase